ncbi:acyl-CoA-binding protein [Dipodascopsis uninucleata]
MVSEAFTKAADSVQQLTTKPTDDELLNLYGLYKQATVGDNNTPKPGVFDLKGKYKWNAWDKLKGKPQEEAEQEYIKYAEELIAKYSS